MTIDLQSLFDLQTTQLANAYTAQPASFTNPVINADFADPHIILGHDGKYYAYATQTCQYCAIQVAVSSDLINWQIQPPGNLGKLPDWAQNTNNVWAPHPRLISKPGAPPLYHMYYSIDPDTKNGMCIALSCSNSPTSGFEDIGEPLIRGAEMGGELFATIDPCPHHDPEFGLILYWGSGHHTPIKARPLADDGRKFLPGSKALSVIHTNPQAEYQSLLEAACVFRSPQNNKLYVLTSGDGLDHYAVVGHELADPFTERRRLGVIFRGNERFQNPGQVCIFKDAADQYWVAYHATDTLCPYVFDAQNNRHNRRVLCLDRLYFNEDSICIGHNNGTPTIGSQAAPITQVSNEAAAVTAPESTSH